MKTPLIGIVLIEVAVLVANGVRCPPTAVAAQITDDRRDSFDRIAQFIEAAAKGETKSQGFKRGLGVSVG